MNPPEPVQVVHVYKTHIWVESDIFGGRHVVMQHEACDPFIYASFHYDYRYTDNAGTAHAAKRLALELGATEPVEQRARALPPCPTQEQIRAQIAALQAQLEA